MVGQEESVMGCGEDVTEAFFRVIYGQTTSLELNSRVGRGS